MSTYSQLRRLAAIEKKRKDDRRMMIVLPWNFDGDAEAWARSNGYAVTASTFFVRTGIPPVGLDLVE